MQRSIAPRRAEMSRLAVIGEAVMDLVAQPGGTLRPMPGGSPYNVALALGRQGVPVDYLSPLSLDAFGDVLHDRLIEAGVGVPLGGRSPRPTSLAVVQVDAAGAPSYTLYREGVADRDTDGQRLVERLPKPLRLLHTGSLALVRSDLPTMRVVFREAKRRGVMIAIDVNMRPGVTSLPGWRAAVRSIMPFCDLVKVSDEDLRLMGLDGDPVEEAAALVAHVGGNAVALTLREGGGALITERHRVERAAYPVPAVVDTIGAGDCFQAGLLAWLRHLDLLRPGALAYADEEALAGLLDHGCATAALNVVAAGCEPPSWQDVCRVVERGRVEAAAS